MPKLPDGVPRDFLRKLLSERIRWRLIALERAAMDPMAQTAYARTIAACTEEINRGAVTVMVTGDAMTEERNYTRTLHVVRETRGATVRGDLSAFFVHQKDEAYVVDLLERAGLTVTIRADELVDHAPPFTVEEVQAQRERLLPSASVGMMLDHLLRLMTLDETVQRQRLMDPTTGDDHREPGNLRGET